MSNCPVLIIGYGNPSRGDDALGPALLDRLELERDAGRIATPFDTVTDFQLQIEHALDLRGRELVLFIDSCVGCPEPYRFSALSPRHDSNYTSHAVSPASLLEVYRQVVDEPLPEAFLLGIAAYQFELGEQISAKAVENFNRAFSFVITLLSRPNTGVWHQVNTST